VGVLLFAVANASAGADDAQQTADSQLPADAAALRLPRKIVLIAGPRDAGHGPGTHEYDATVDAIAGSLAGSNVADLVEVAVVKNGWPDDPKLLDDADTILLVSSGADRNVADHPFLVGDRMQILERQMDRGCGLMLLHWSVFVPVKF